MSELAEAIAASVDTGDTAAQSATTPEPAPAAAETTPTETSTPADTAAQDAATGESEWRIDSAEFDAQHPELAPYRKQLQADFTRRQQELAEQRRQIEGLDEGSIQWVRQVRQLAQTNPEIAAQLLEAERQRLVPQAPPQEEQVWYSDGERLLAQQVQQLQQTVRQQELAYQKAAVETETAQLERAIGKQLSPQERDGLYTFCAQKRVNLEDGWKLMDYDRAVQRGMDKARQVAQQKAGMGPAPGSTASREPPPADRQPKTAREALEMAYEEAERRAA